MKSTRPGGGEIAKRGWGKRGVSRGFIGGFGLRAGLGLRWNRRSERPGETRVQAGLPARG
jgi:hypothetical protein